MAAESTNTMINNSFEDNGDGTFSLRTTGTSGGTAQTVATEPNDAANSTSVTDTATVTSPAALQTIAVTPALSVGTWDIECITYIGGTTVGSLESINMRLLVGAAAIGRIMNPVPNTAGGVGTGQLRVRYVVTSGTPTASIIAVLAGTTGAIYSGSIVAKRVV